MNVNAAKGVGKLRLERGFCPSCANKLKPRLESGVLIKECRTCGFEWREDSGIHYKPVEPRTEMEV